MQLKIQRSQRAGGVIGNTIFFCLDVRADYAPEEQANIRKYKLGGQAIYNSQAARKLGNSSISVAASSSCCIFFIPASDASLTGTVCVHAVRAALHR